MPPQCRGGYTRKISMEGHQNGKVTEEALLQKEAERAETLEFGEGEAQGDLIKVYKHLK